MEGKVDIGIDGGLLATTMMLLRGVFIFNCQNMLKFVGQILLRNSKICWIMCEKKEELKYAI